MAARVIPSYVVIGTSAGGVTALRKVLKEIPEDFPGAILVVMHVGEGGSVEWLAEQLRQVGRLPVNVAADGTVIRQGSVYIAPASTHLLIDKDRVRLGTGPREQYARPAIDVLFRSAASVFGRRVIGVILTGTLRDGTLGMRAVQEAGGITIVQDPKGAEASEMPRSAMKDLAVDYCLELPDIGPTLNLLVRRAGSYKKGVLETGLASAVRLMKDRTRLLRTLQAQSQRNPKTAAFLAAEIAALRRDVATIQRLIPIPATRRRKA
jgi:two-component system chemotaxis response regulator CheB